MFAQPTIEDFCIWIRWHLDKAAIDAAGAVSKVEREHAARGVYHSSMTIIAVLEAVHEKFDPGIEAALGELKRAIGMTQLDRDDLRRSTEEELRAFVERMRAAAKPDKLHKIAGNPLAIIDDRLAEFDTKLAFALRQFDVGFLVPREPEVSPHMINVLKIDEMSGGAIQQGSTNSTQNVSITLDVKAVTASMAKFEAEMRAVKIPDDKLAEITADLNTIKSQLAKPTPSKSIIAEAGRSLRNVTEGIIAGALSSEAALAAMALWAALGLS